LDGTGFRNKFLTHSCNKGENQYWNGTSLKIIFLSEFENCGASLIEEVSPIVFKLLKYLSSVPFRTNLDVLEPDLIKTEELLRAVFWLLPREAQNTTWMRSLAGYVHMGARSAADQRRLFFEGLANFEGDFQFNISSEQKASVEKPREVEECFLDMILTYFDEEDKRYHDILDVFTYTQDDIRRPNEAFYRDYFRPIVSKLKRPIALRQLAISRDRLKPLIMFSLNAHIESLQPVDDIIQEIAANALLNSSCQSIETNAIVTWQKFDDALTKTAVSFPLYGVSIIC
jgi:hypothetical protein